MQQCIGELTETECRQELTLEHYDKSIYLTDLWPQDDATDPILGVASVLLIFGALLAAASVVGADWRSGMLATLLTWEPRRVRVAAARVSSAAFAAAAIALLLQLVLIAALLPSMLLHGGTGGADAEWWRGLVVAMGKGAALTGLAAIVGASLALIGRNTAIALGAAFVYLNFVESAVRAWRPGLGRWLITDNAAAFLMGPRSDVVASPVPAIMLVVYAVGLFAAAAAVFRRRDIPSVGA